MEGEFEFEFVLEIDFEFKNEFEFEFEIELEFEFAFCAGVRVLKANFRTDNIDPHRCPICSHRSPRSVPGTSPFAHRRVRPAAPGKETEKDRL